MKKSGLHDSKYSIIYFRVMEKKRIYGKKKHIYVYAQIYILTGRVFSKVLTADTSGSWDHE